MGYQVVTLLMTSRDPKGAVRQYGRLSSTAWLPVLNADVRDASMVRFAFSICSEDSKCVSIQPLFTMSMQRHEP